MSDECEEKVKAGTFFVSYSTQSNLRFKFSVCIMLVGFQTIIFKLYQSHNATQMPNKLSLQKKITVKFSSLSWVTCWSFNHSITWRKKSIKTGISTDHISPPQYVVQYLAKKSVSSLDSESTNKKLTGSFHAFCLWNVTVQMSGWVQPNVTSFKHFTGKVTKL